MNTQTVLHRLLTQRQAEDHLNEQAARLMRDDSLPAATALRLVRERVERGDATVLAAAGQVWTMRPEWAELAAWASGTTLRVTARLTCPPAALVEDERGVQKELRLTGLTQMYELTEWNWTP